MAFSYDMDSFPKSQIILQKMKSQEEPQEEPTSQTQAYVDDLLTKSVDQSGANIFSHRNDYVFSAEIKEHEKLSLTKVKAKES